MKRIFHPNLGFEYFLNGRSIILQMLMMTKDHVKFSNNELKELIKITNKYFDAIRELPPVDLSGNLLTEQFQNYDGSLYKFVNPVIYDNYISKGSFQLGSLKYYREIEQSKARDIREGYSNLLITKKAEIFLLR